MTKKLTYSYVKDRVEERGYSLASKNYKNNYTKLKLLCQEHGLFEITYNNVSKGHGCPECGGTKRFTIEYAREKTEERGYELVSKSYKGNRAKLKFFCSEHGIFKMTYADFSRGSDCPSCAVSGFDPRKPATLYYLEITHRGRLYYKIGITNKSVQKRYSLRDRKKITILAEWKYEDGRECYDAEQSTLRYYEDYRYHGSAKILEGASGNTEIFTENILQL